MNDQFRHVNMRASKHRMQDLNCLRPTYRDRLTPPPGHDLPSFDPMRFREPADLLDALRLYLDAVDRACSAAVDPQTGTADERLETFCYHVHERLAEATAFFDGRAEPEALAA